jgi:hypothetical protein
LIAVALVAERHAQLEKFGRRRRGRTGSSERQVIVRLREI